MCKLYVHQVIVCTRNLNPRLKAKLDRNYPHQNGQTLTQAPHAGFLLSNRLISFKVVDSCWIFSTKWSDTFRSVFVYGKEQES